MTENEIINILKENKTKGIAFGFMPKEVKEWCSKNDSNLVYYSVNGTWFSGDNRSIFDMNEIVALPDSFQIQQEKKGGWVEFKIDGDGDFNLKDDGTESTKDEGRDFGFHWSAWGEFLKCSINEKWHYTAFGGWKYPHSNAWSMSPQVQLGRGAQNYSGYYSTGLEDDTRPAIPTKIRFWRSSK